MGDPKAELLRLRRSVEHLLEKRSFLTIAALFLLLFVSSARQFALPVYA